jgi:hypothetical protein
MCESLVQKLTAGEALDDAEKSHLAECEGCVAQIVKSLDKAAVSAAPGADLGAGEANGNRGGARPEAMKALEHGRQVFEREFGISLSTKKSGGPVHGTGSGKA